MTAAEFFLGTHEPRWLYTACGNRRANVCSACSDVYRADTYQLILAGLRGGKGIPEEVAGHPCVIATFTAPSFGYVHSRREKRRSHKDQPVKALPCRPHRRPEYCPHGVNLVCNRSHRENEKCLGQPLCRDRLERAAS
jgi:Replication initiator protein, pSAM2